jgi:cytoskeleton protein RodZ
MEPLFEELKRAREAKRLSLSDIADATLININYLEQIEKGNTTILPQTYVRAFIREYAAIVGLNPDEVIQKYEHSDPKGAPSAHTPPPTVADRAEPVTTSPALLRWVFISVGVIGAAIILWASFTKESAPPVQEIPFQSVVTENEKRFAPQPAPQKPPEEIRPAVALADSLVLRASTTDTVWVQMTVDQNPPREYIFRPNSHITWKARDGFTVTLGNGGAIQFTLNQKQLGTLGKPGSVVRNIQLSRKTLAQK